MADEHFYDFIEGLETPEHYEWLVSYMNMGPGRTLARVAQLHNVGYGTICAAAKRGSWRDRSTDFDADWSAERAQALAQRRAAVTETWAERRAQILDQLEAIAVLGAEQLLYDLKNKRRALRPNELRLITETVTKWQNLANGDATEKVDFGLDYSKLSDEQLAALEEIEHAARVNPSESKNSE